MSWLRRAKNDEIPGASGADHREPTLGAAVPPAAEHVGVVLRECREHYGEDLRSIAQTLRIRLAYLQAIEQGHFEALPGATYAVGFVRAYADYLGLDSDAILQRFRAGTSDMPSRSQLDFPVAPAEGKFPNATTMVVSLVLVVATMVGWQYFSEGGDRPTLVAAVAPAGDAPLNVRVPAPRMSEDAAGVPAIDVGPADPTAAPAPPTIAAITAVPEALDDDARDGGAVLPAIIVPIESPLDSPVGDAIVAAIDSPPGDAVVAAIDQPAGSLLESLDGAISPAIVPPDATPAPVVAVPADPLADPLPAVLVARAEPPALALVEPVAGNAAEAPDIPVTELPLPPATTARLSGGPERELDEPEGRIYGMPNRNSRIIIGAETDSWVQIRDQSQADVFTRLLRAGDRYRVPNRDGLTLLTGNAGGLWITIDGQTAPRIGELGEVARDVPLIPDRLKTGATAVN